MRGGSETSRFGNGRIARNAARDCVLRFQKACPNHEFHRPRSSTLRSVRSVFPLRPANRRCAMLVRSVSGFAGRALESAHDVSLPGLFA
jgi:hypothetical protein